MHVKHVLLILITTLSFNTSAMSSEEREIRAKEILVEFDYKMATSPQKTTEGETPEKRLKKLNDLWVKQLRMVTALQALVDQQTADHERRVAEGLPWPSVHTRCEYQRVLESASNTI
jgi:hypothetical protein